MPFQPVKAESLSAQVFETIRDAIFRGELKPGETLRELGLAKSLNVSQATVREALEQERAASHRASRDDAEDAH